MVENHSTPQRRKGFVAADNVGEKYIPCRVVNFVGSNPLPCKSLQLMRINSSDFCSLTLVNMDPFKVLA